MSFDYPTGYVFRTCQGFYYTYLGYDENANNPYSFIVTYYNNRNKSYINEHSKYWTETAIQNNILIPIMPLSNNLLFDIQTCITNVTKLHHIAESNNLSEEVEKYIKTFMGYSYRLDVTN
uniref:Uncharacterized protein n=1 Tax=viral metagenome TaxID=1070528 RepID=A0A6C0DMQ3_9ZZZZ